MEVNMGLYYTSYIEELKKEYKKNKHKTFDDFLTSNETILINEEYEQPYGSFYWVLNITKLAEDLKIIESEGLRLAHKILKDDSDCDDGMF